MSNIEKVDSGTLLRKDKVMSGVSWPARFQQAISTWPSWDDLGAAAAQVRLSLLSPIIDLEMFAIIFVMCKSHNLHSRTRNVVPANVINPPP